MGSFRRIMFVLVVPMAASAVLLILRPAAAAPGDLDPSFGSGGKVDTAIGSDAFAFGLALQQDGKIVAAGATSPSSRLALARYESDGGLDPSFGAGGLVVGTGGSQGCCGAVDVDVQPDGKLVVIMTGSHANRPALVLARYLPNGAPDAAFGSDGRVTGPEGTAAGLVLQPDGKIVALGTASLTYAFVLARFNGDGTIDPSFGPGGTVRTVLGSASLADSVVLQRDGKIVAGGASVAGAPPPPPPPPPAPPPPPPPGPPPLPWQLTLARYAADGSLDPSFGSNGIVRTRWGFSARINAVGLDSQSRIVAAGETREFGLSADQRILARYKHDGALDPAFGVGGIVVPTVDSEGRASALAIQEDGKIVVGSTRGVARHREDGRPDPAFGLGGVGEAGRPSLSVSALAMQRDGRIVAAGSRTAPGASRFSLNRYLARSPTTIEAAGVVRYGRATTISGTLSRGERGVRVEVARRGCFDFQTRTVATTATRAGGRWSVRLRATSRTVFHAEVDAQTSLPLVVRVRPRVTLSRIARGRYRAQVVSGHSLRGQPVVLQRFTRRKWVTAKEVRLRRVARRGPAVISSRAFAARNTAGRRLRLSYSRPGEHACYAPATSMPIRG